jgi:hypothetical protein
MAIEAVNLTEAAQGVYFTLNPLDPELLAANRQRIAQFRRIVFRYLIATTNGRRYRQQSRD